jgi:ATP-dependent Clp protease adaptor protein ClpS
MGSDQNFIFGPDAELQINEEIELREPKMYRVIIHNDNFTTMEFVVEILIKIFRKPAKEAAQIMLDVHRRGSGVCGVYSLDIARTKVSQVHALARQNDFPLRCSYEEA